MPVSGLVLTLTPRADGLGIRHTVSQHPAIEAGEVRGRKLPLVSDTNCHLEDRRVWEWLQSLPGVHHVDVVFIHFDDEDRSMADSATADSATALSDSEPDVEPATDGDADVSTHS